MATLDKTSYTKINTTSESDYLIQNTSSDTIRFIVAATQPANDAAHTGVLNPGNGISNKDIEGFVWGKSTVFDELDITPIKG